MSHLPLSPHIYKIVSCTFEDRNYQCKPNSYPFSSQPERTLSLSTFCARIIMFLCLLHPVYPTRVPVGTVNRDKTRFQRPEKRGGHAWNSWWSAFLLAILTGNRLVGGTVPSNHENKSKSNDKSIPYYNSFDISSFSLSPPLFSISSLSVA